jgi:Zn-dependent protease
MIPFRMHDKGWLLLAFCVLIGIRISGWRLGLGVVAGALLVASLLLHEAGHMLIVTALGVRVLEFGICLGGAYNRRACAPCGRDEVLISAAGPLMNLCLVIPSLFLPRIGAQLALCNLVLCVVNLLLLPSSDGLRILRTVWHFNRAGDRMPGLVPRNSTLTVRRSDEIYKWCTGEALAVAVAAERSSDATRKSE